MAAFFAGLDGRLRVSGMVADSIMMGIVNSSMEDAYKKSCSKEGDFERLKEKSRFCELAIMQLEWCLKYLKEEIDNNIAESACDREQLIDDLSETRDRIQNRLDDTDIAIAEKDMEINKRKESEVKLRLALEMKGEEVCSLHNALFLEGVKNAMESNFVSSEEMSGCGKKKDHVFSELRKSATQKIIKIRSKLEDRRGTLISLMQNVRNRSADHDGKLNPELDVDGDGKRLSQGYHDLVQLNLDLEEIVLETETLEDEIASSFEAIASSVSSFKAMMEEQQYTWNNEKEVINIVIGSCLREFKCPFNLRPVVRPFFQDTNWMIINDDMANLLDELETLSSQIPRAGSGMELRSHRSLPPRIALEEEEHLENKKTSLERRTSGNYLSGRLSFDGDEGNCASEKLYDDLLHEENPSGHSIADLIRSHESIIRKKMEESSWLKAEHSREKVYNSLKNDNSFDSLREIIDKVIQKLASIQGNMSKFVEARRDKELSPNTSGSNTLQLNLSDFEAINNKLKFSETSHDRSDKSCCHSINAKFTQEMIMLRDEMEFKSQIFEQTFATLIKDSLNKVILNSFASKEEMLLREDICRIVYSHIVKEFSDKEHNSAIRECLRKEIDLVVFSEVVKVILLAQSLTQPHSQKDEIVSSGDLNADSMTNKTSERQEKLNTFVKDSNIYKNSIATSSSRLEPHSSESDACNLQQPTEGNVPDDQELTKTADTCSSVDIKFGLQGQKLKFGGTQVEEQVSTSGVIMDGNVPYVPSNSKKGSVLPLEEFLETIQDFELTTCKRLSVNVSRLEDIVLRFNGIVDQLNSVKQNELIYRKAFTRRCYDLQTAEKEVDLLGDEVDVLSSLFEKIYMVLDHYLPVLQHYSGIMEVLKLIKKYDMK